MLVFYTESPTPACVDLSEERTDVKNIFYLQAVSIDVDNPSVNCCIIHRIVVQDSIMNFVWETFDDGRLSFKICNTSSF